MLTKRLRTKDTDAAEAKASHAWFYGPGDDPEPVIEIPARWRNGEGSVSMGWRRYVQRNGEASFYVRVGAANVVFRLVGVRMRVGGSLWSDLPALQFASETDVDNMRAYLAERAAA